MMSIKRTFSLTIFITILALAFTVAPAMAQFEVSLSIADDNGATDATANNGDISAADGIQVERSPVVVNVKFDKVVNATTTGGPVMPTYFEADDIDVVVYNMFGGTIAATGTIAIAATTPADGQNFTVTIPSQPPPASRVIVAIKKASVELADPRAELDDKGARKAAGKNKAGHVEFHYVAAEAADGDPKVLSIKRSDGMLRPVTAATFDVLITLSEMPRKDGFKADKIDVSNAKAADPVAIEPMKDTDAFGTGEQADTLNDGGTRGMSTGRDGMHHRYVVTITPKYENKNDIVVKVKSFLDQEKPAGNAYPLPTTPGMYTEGGDMLTVKVGKEDLKAKTAGTEVVLAKDEFIPANGYFVITKNTDASEIVKPPGDNEPKAHQRDEGERLYNIQQRDTIPNLETFLSNGGVIDVKSPVPLIITEVMWGSDASLGGKPGNAQWIELHNPGGQHKIVENTIYLVFYTHSERPPARNADGTLPSGIVDRIGTLNDAGSGLWTLAGKGQSGRTGHGEDKMDVLTAAIPYTNIVSMYRIKSGTEWAGGQMAASWMASTPPSDNFDPNQPGHRTGSPGAATDMSGLEAAAAAAAKAKADAAEKAKADAAEKAKTTGTVPEAGNIYISEVMFAGGGSLPQWIEIANSSRTEEVNLSGWTLTIDNAAGDTDVSVGGSIKFTIPAGTMIGTYGQNNKPSTILVVTELGRYDLGQGAGQVLNLWTDGDGQTQLILAGVNKRRYSLLSGDAFQITLAPPAPAATTPPAGETAAAKAQRLAAERVAADARKAATDTVGNLGADGMAAWALPMSEEGARSSIIRSHVQVNIGPAEPNKGTMMDGWVLAANTAFAQPTHVRTKSYYGAPNDVGTPGFRSGGALPVQLSHFRPARQKETGQVVITWATQSELNNAGFFIKRSQQRDGEFKVINAAMVPGAGTTSEKQFYTYTDTTAQPNVVYYYQIEDVSLDGNHQTLTRGIRLKGHIGAAGKATTLWGELKSSNE